MGDASQLHVQCRGVGYAVEEHDRPDFVLAIKACVRPSSQSCAAQCSARRRMTGRCSRWPYARPVRPALGRTPYPAWQAASGSPAGFNRGTVSRGLPLPANSGSHCTAGSSRSSFPASRNCMIAVPVNVFVMDAIRYSVSGPACRRDAMSAKPAPPAHTSSSPCTTPAAAPAMRLSLTNLATFASNSAAPPATGSVISARSHRRRPELSVSLLMNLLELRRGGKSDAAGRRPGTPAATWRRRGAAPAYQPRARRYSRFCACWALASW